MGASNGQTSPHSQQQWESSGVDAQRAITGQNTDRDTMPKKITARARRNNVLAGFFPTADMFMQHGKNKVLFFSFV